MSNLPISPDVVPLLQGLKPFIGSNGQVLADSVIHLVKLFTSSHGQEAVQAVSNALSASGKSDKVLTINTYAGPITLNLGLVFALFLILILLVLSSTFMSINSSELGNYQQAETYAGTEV